MLTGNLGPESLTDLSSLWQWEVLWRWENLWWMVPVAFLLDLVIGDPRWLPHPVVFIGNAIDKMEAILRRIVHSPKGKRRAGVLLWLVIVGGTIVVTWGLLIVMGKISPWLRLLVEIYLLSTALAAKGLAQAALSIKNRLSAGNLDKARQEVGYIVGRDTERLDEQEIVRATVETVAENNSDGVIAPLFFAFLGGAPLAYAYKAVNTLDSMVGYKNDKYRDFGRASARLDDLFNYLPARLTALFLWASSLLWGYHWRRAFKTMLSDARKHPSPNGGYPEAIVAGALGVRLGGHNCYGGTSSFRAYLGEPVNTLSSGHIADAVKLMLTAAALFVTAGSVVLAVVILRTT